MLCTLLNLLEPGLIRRVLLDTVGQRWNSFQQPGAHLSCRHTLSIGFNLSLPVFLTRLLLYDVNKTPDK